MPRPEGIDPSDIFRWVCDAETYLDQTTLPPLMDHDQFIESFIAGQWLGSQLCELGLAKDEVERQCFVQGQIHAAQKLMGIDDPWASCFRVLRACEVGDFFAPGPELSKQLMRETLGDNFERMPQEIKERLNTLLDDLYDE